MQGNMKYTIIDADYDPEDIRLAVTQADTWEEVIETLIKQLLFYLDDRGFGLDCYLFDDPPEDFSRDSVCILRGESHEVVPYPGAEVVPQVLEELRIRKKAADESREKRQREEDERTFQILKERLGK